jgi:isopenicillin-N N-acyltransferase-like protein
MSELKEERILKVVEVSGSHYEMGFQYGKACPEISTILDLTCQLFGGNEKTKDIQDRYVPIYLPYLQNYAPEIMEEMKGMADGADVNFHDIMLLNITYEISVPSVMGGCTSFAAMGKATSGGGLISGQNIDHIEPWLEHMILLKMKPEDGPDVMAVTAPGCLTLAGINSAGISINMNLLRNSTSLEPAGGVPTHVILRKLFMSNTLGEVIAAIASAEGRCPKNYLLTSTGEGILDIETTTTDMDIQFPEREMLTHANYFKAERFRSTDLAPSLVPDAYIRSNRLFRLMEEHYGDISVEVMKRLLQDHSNYPNSICRHRDANAPFPYARIMKTLISIINVPEEKKVYIAVGNPCKNEYIEYKM